MRRRSRPVLWIAVLALVAAGAVARIARPSSWVTVTAIKLPSGPLFLAEDPSHPRLQALRRQEHLDRFMQKRPELENLLALAQWTSKLFPPTSPFPNYPPWDALEILKRIRGGQTGGFCAQYAQIFAQACQAYGYGVRLVGLVNPDFTSGHVVTEVFVPSVRKWVAFDAQNGLYYRSPLGMPLGVLDIHEAAVHRRPGQVVALPTGYAIDPGWLPVYTHFKFNLRNNFLSVPVYWRREATPKGPLVIFEPYCLRWIDRFTAKARESAPALTSSRREDFDFPYPASLPPPARCRSEADLTRLILTLRPLEVCRLQLPKALLVRLIEEVLIGDKRFVQLKAQ